MTEQAEQHAGTQDSMRRAGAFLLDFATAFFASGFIVTVVSGGSYVMTPKMIFASAAMMVLYFVLGRMAGGTLWQRVARMA